MQIKLSSLESNDNMSLVMRKPAFCICENKDADQLCGYREADHAIIQNFLTLILASKCRPRCDCFQRNSLIGSALFFLLVTDRINY